jgi:hypothetical protein
VGISTRKSPNNRASRTGSKEAQAMRVLAIIQEMSRARLRTLMCYGDNSKAQVLTPNCQSKDCGLWTKLPHGRKSMVPFTYNETRRSARPALHPPCRSFLCTETGKADSTIISWKVKCSNFNTVLLAKLGTEIDSHGAEAMTQESSNSYRGGSSNWE